MAILILTQEFTHSQYKEEPSCSSNKLLKKPKTKQKQKTPRGNYLITLNGILHNGIHTRGICNLTNLFLPFTISRIFSAYLFVVLFCTWDLKGQTIKCFALIIVCSSTSCNKTSVNTASWFMPSISQSF